MAETLDVAGRLAEGRPAVDTVGDYVWACHLLGYQNPDLTLHPAQIQDWYGSEDGLDLRALESDRAALGAAAAATDSALRLQEQQLDALAGAWLGRGGDASREFLLRHGDASMAAATAVRDAVDAFAALRDELWRAIDDKVTSAVEIDDRRHAERATWLAATRTLTTGTGDRAAASELIEQQVKPFVDNDIRADWLAAMQKAMTAISTAFDAATASLSGQPAPQFEVPGDLGPRPAAPSLRLPLPADAPGTVPAGWGGAAVGGAPAMAPAASPMTAPVPAYPAGPEPLAAPMPPTPAPAAAPAAATPATPGVPPIGDLASGLSSGAGGLAGLGNQLADALGGLLSGPGDTLPDAPETANAGLDGTADQGRADDVSKLADDEPDNDDPEDDDEDVAEGDADADEQGDGGPESVTDESTSEPVKPCEDAMPVDASAPEPVPTPPAPPPPQPIVETPPSPEPLGAETPCEIAADELPQAGP